MTFRYGLRYGPPREELNRLCSAAKAWHVDSLTYRFQIHALVFATTGVASFVAMGPVGYFEFGVFFIGEPVVASRRPRLAVDALVAVEFASSGVEGR
jgi:hypothetical protein